MGSLLATPLQADENSWYYEIFAGFWGAHKVHKGKDANLYSFKGGQRWVVADPSSKEERLHHFNLSTVVQAKLKNNKLLIITIHGHVGELGLKDGRWITEETIVSMMKNAGVDFSAYHGIVLVSCSANVRPSFLGFRGKSSATKLANLSGLPVISPNGLVVHDWVTTLDLTQNTGRLETALHVGSRENPNSPRYKKRTWSVALPKSKKLTAEEQKSVNDATDTLNQANGITYYGHFEGDFTESGRVYSKGRLITTLSEHARQCINVLSRVSQQASETGLGEN